MRIHWIGVYFLFSFSLPSEFFKFIQFFGMLQSNQLALNNNNNND